jgi:hypothetical protein
MKRMSSGKVKESPKAADEYVGKKLWHASFVTLTIVGLAPEDTLRTSVALQYF